MHIHIDTEAQEVTVEDGGVVRDVTPLYSPQGFAIVSDLWLKVGWDQKHPYTFSWLGRPVIQMPEDLLRLQEVVYRLRPDVIVETGIAHGGSAVFLASLCRLLDHGRVVAVDIDIRPHNMTALADHPLADLITLIEGDSTAADVVQRVRSEVADAETVLIILDSDHSYQHVSEELEHYGPLVTPGSWIVATDGIMRLVADTPRGTPNWRDDNPAAAARDFLRQHPEFVMQSPTWQFNESPLKEPVTHWPDAWLLRA